MLPTPLIYSELLSNICQISIIASLPTPCNTTTKTSLSNDGRAFYLHHDSLTTLFPLPGPVAPQTQPITLPIGSTELSFRFPLKGKPSRAADAANEGGAPWNAASLNLNLEGQFACRDCGNVVLEKGAVGSWKDLPSENWAEMMDFWHCHKPSVPANEGGEQGEPDKGYGPAARFAATKGVGFVDLTTLLLSEDDCVRVQSSPPQTQPKDIDTMARPSYQPISCTTCNHYIGYHDPQNSGSRLYKWRLTLALPTTTTTHTESQPPTPPTPSLSHILSAQLLSIIHSQCVSRILILPHPTSPLPTSQSTTTPPSPSPQQETQPLSPSLSLWIFAPSIRYSSSLCPSTSPSSNPSTQKPGTPAMKIFYQTVSLPLPNTTDANASTNMSKSMSANQEELYLPAETIVELLEILGESQNVLPLSARRFQGWDVGLLGRWEA